LEARWWTISQSSPGHDNKILNLCNGVLSLDKAINFCAVAHKSGYLISYASRDTDTHPPNHDGSELVSNSVSHGKEVEGEQAGLHQLPHLSEAEMEKYTFHAGIRYGLNKSWEHKFGKIKQFVAYYDHVTLVTIMLDDTHFLLVGFEPAKSGKLEHFVSQKLTPYLEKQSVSI